MLDLERQIALDAVQAAARIGQAVQSAVTLGRWDKEDRTPVTVADLAIQAVIGLRLSAAFPGDPFMATGYTTRWTARKVSSAANSTRSHWR